VDFSLDGVMDGAASAGVPHAAELLPFADAVIARDPARIAAARAVVLETLGEAAMLDAAAVIAGFNGITRIADATGIPLEDDKAEKTAAWRAELGIGRFRDLKS
jgi:hypothetical protein